MELIGKVKVANNRFIEYGYTEGVLEDPITFDDAWEGAFVICGQTEEFFGEEFATDDAAITFESENFAVFLPDDFLKIHSLDTGNEEEEDYETLKKNADALAGLFEKWYEGEVFDLVLKNEYGDELDRMSPVSEHVNDYNVEEIWKQYGGADF